MLKISAAFALAFVVLTGLAARVEALPTAPPTATAGADECRAGATQPACRARPFVRTADLAWSGNGFARPAVAKNTIAGFAIHNATNLNDGFYGNGASWVSASADAWVKIDLGRVVRVDGILLGRDRTGAFTDRGTGGFVVSLATTEGAYATGVATDDDTEYTKVLEVAAAEATGAPAGTSYVVNITPTLARFVKVQLKASGAALDEIEVFGAVPIEVDACLTSPCANTMDCTDRPGTDTGPAGRTCACKTGYAAGADGACVDVDECAAGTDGCVEGCKNLVGSFSCINDPVWTSSGEAGFPQVANVGYLTVATETPLAAVRVPSSVLQGPSRVLVTAIPGANNAAVTLAVGAMVEKSDGPTTVLPLPYTLLPGWTYQVTLETGAEKLNLVTVAPLARAAFQVVPRSRLALAPPTNRERTAVGGVRSRAYEVKVNAETRIAAVAWIVMPCFGQRLEARIWDERGVVLARGLVVSGPSQMGPVASPLTFTFEVGRTYLVGFYDESGGVAIPFKDLGPDAVGLTAAQPAYTKGGLTVSAVRSSRPADAEQGPLVDNAFGPLIELVLTSGTP